MKFGNAEEAIKFLRGRGFVLLPSFYWKAPYLGYLPTKDEYDALDYLFHEWDFGDIVNKDE